MRDKTDFKTFDDGGADQLLRETLAGHHVEPKASLWKDISRKLLWKELLHFNFTNLSLKFWMAGTTGVLVVAAILYFGHHGITPENEAITNTVRIAPAAITSGKPAAKPVAGVVDNSDQKSAESTVVAPRDSRSPSIERPVKPRLEKERMAIAASPDIQKRSNQTWTAESVIVPGDMNEPDITFSNDAGFATTREITHMSPLTSDLWWKSPETDTIIAIHNAKGLVKFRKTMPAAVQFFSASIGVAPEIAFYSDPEAYSKTNFWLNGGLTYHISRFSIATGFGLGYVFDEGKYRVEYKSNDSIGYFTGVISYSVGNNNEMIYQTRTVTVYDSLDHLADSRTKNRYTYLQVPLLLGYRFFESNRVSFTFQAGPAISFLLGSRKSDPVIEYPDARIIRVDDDTPLRVMTNWQILANLYFEMRVNRKVSIYVEPSFKYYLKPMVTQENVKFKTPWTIGLGVGLQFNFGQKKTSP
jgi:hypothetical protein